MDEWDDDSVFEPSPPTLNDPVYYVARGSADGAYPPVNRSAIVTATIKEEPGRLNDPWKVELFVMNPDGQFFNHNVSYDKDRGPGTWHYGWEPDVYGTESTESGAFGDGATGGVAE